MSVDKKPMGWFQTALVLWMLVCIIGAVVSAALVAPAFLVAFILSGYIALALAVAS